MQPIEVVMQAATAERGQSRPRPAALQAALLSLEKQVRRDKTRHAPESLVGQWRLRFVTGAARSRGGFYVPTWARVEIRYSLQAEDSGRVENHVACGPLHLAVTGPIQFCAPRNILAFDFTQLQIHAFARQLYQGPLRGGPEREARFPELPVARQAFFTYFLVTPEAIAARGRGGGLALWSRSG